MNNKKLIDIIYNYIKKNGGVSFVEVERIFEENGFEYEGDMMITVSVPNVIVWGFWNKEAIEIMNVLKSMGVELKTSSPLIYYYDGKALNFPLCRSSKGYKNELHWLPAVMNVVDSNR